MAKSEINLSHRQREILQLIYEGNTDGEISNFLNISSHTVRTHRENLRKKFGVRNTPSMLRIAVEQKLISNNLPT